MPLARAVRTSDNDSYTVAWCHRAPQTRNLIILRNGTLRCYPPQFLSEGRSSGSWPQSGFWKIIHSGSHILRRRAGGGQEDRSAERPGAGLPDVGAVCDHAVRGEAQRIKIATELSKLQRSKHTVHILDEPTTGLHLADIERLLESLNRLVDAGHTVLLIEHHLDVIKTADHVIDLGPEGGHAGGEVVVTGTPEAVAACKASHTGRFLRPRLRVKQG